MKDPTVKISLMSDGSIEVAVGSGVKPGRLSKQSIPDCRSRSEREILRAVAFVTHKLADHQVRTFGDNHDESALIKAAVGATKELLDDPKSMSKYKNPRMFAPAEKGDAGGIKTQNIDKPARPNWT